MNNVDIVIPTHNRPELLKRILNYYQEYGQDFNFIIADSSKKTIKTSNRRLLNNYPKLKILYIDKFSSDINQHIKFAEMVKYLKNKYVCFCPDDDYIIPNGIKECVNFLEKNPDYSAAHGNYIGFYLHRDLFGSYKFWWQYRYSLHTISFSNPLERVVSHLENFTLVLWSVRRTDVVRTSYQEFLKAKIDPYLLIIFGELLPDVLTALFGKIKWLNTFYGARQYFGSIAYNFASPIDAKNAGKYDTEYNKFRECISNNLAKLDNISTDKANKLPRTENPRFSLKSLQEQQKIQPQYTTYPRKTVSASSIHPPSNGRVFSASDYKAIDSAMEIYTRYSYQEHLTNRVYFFLRNYPKFISQWLRVLHARYLFSKKRKDIMKLGNPSSKYYADFKAIRQSVLESKI